MTESPPTADELFQAELDQRGLQYELQSDGLYKVTVGDLTATVNLDNIRRNYERDNDRDAITRFAAQLSPDSFEGTPSWADVQPFVRFSLEPSNYENGFEDTVHEVVNDDLVKVFVYITPDGSRIGWISNAMVADWQVTNDEVVAIANQNMNLIVSETELETENIDGAPLGMLSTQEMPFKASLILTSGFRELVSPTHGWPVYVVVPARDFVYVVPTANHDFLGRMGAVVLREYSESGHPVSQDVLQVGDDGVTAIGSFAPRDK